jgi:type IV pilus assembly protein PilE
VGQPVGNRDVVRSFMDWNILIGISGTSQDNYYTITVSGTSATAYSLSAAPKSPHTDSKCGTLTINESSVKTATGDADYCWGK